MGIDSSTPESSVALVKDGRVLNQAEVDTNATVSNQILVLVDNVLTASNSKLADLDGFCLTTGPGSFTGLRVGASILKGLLLATSKPFVKIDSLEAVAWQAMPTNSEVCAILDAKKKEVYTARFRPNNGTLKRLTSDQALTPNQLCQEIKEPTIFIGNGLNSYSLLLTSQLGKKFLPIQHKPPYTVAACAARIAEDRFENQKKNNPDEVNIKYVRKPEAELKLKEKEPS